MPGKMFEIVAQDQCTNAIGIALCLAITVAVGLALPLDLTSVQLMERTGVSLGGVVLALASGATGDAADRDRLVGAPGGPGRPYSFEGVVTFFAAAPESGFRSAAGGGESTTSHTPSAVSQATTSRAEYLPSTVWL